MSLPTTEEWRPIPGYEGVYEVSSAGRIRSIPRTTTRGGIRALVPGTNGYLTVRLYRDGMEEGVGVHRLVALAFCERAEGQRVVRHLDGNRTNNVPSNLAWGTHSENSRDMLRHGTHPLAHRSECKNGHEYTDENTGRTKRGARYCRACIRESGRRHYAAHKARVLHDRKVKRGTAT